MRPLNLASTSLRRQELLGWLGLPFTVITPDFDEYGVDYAAFARVEEYVQCLAAGKALSVVPQCPAASVIISGDTMVVCDDTLLGKPKDLADARRMLHILRGRTHQVYSAVTCYDTQRQDIRSRCSVTDVTFAPITDTQVESYLKTSESFGKAGGYGIQGTMRDFVQRIEGSVTGVIGFPLEVVIPMLEEAGYSVQSDFMAMQRVHLARSW